MYNVIKMFVAAIESVGNNQRTESLGCNKKGICVGQMP